MRRRVAQRPIMRSVRAIALMVLSWATIASGIEVAFGSSAARAQENAFVHTVRPGETLASIAQRYYGDPRRETALVAENGLTAQGGAAIVVGLKLLIPHVRFHRVVEGETWPELASRFYGDPKRAFVLIEANGGAAGAQPDVGAELLIPYPLRHVAAQGERVDRISQAYYGSNDGVRRLRRFNSLRGVRMQRGQIVLIPMAELTLSAEGRGLIEEATGKTIDSGEARNRQAAIDAQLPELRDHVRRGNYTEATALGNQLLGAGELTGNQVVTIQRELAFAYVALRQFDMAEAAFVAALTRQPDLELDALRTSPIVLRAFEAAKKAYLVAAEEAAAERAAAADAGAEDAGKE